MSPQRIAPFSLASWHPLLRAAPAGLHDDCAVALALVDERARRYTPFHVAFVGKPLVIKGDLLETYRKKRADPDWGWNRSFFS